MEGPVPHLDARLCALLSITPLTIVRVVEEDGELSSVRSSGGPGNVVTGYNHGMEGNEYSSRRRGLIAALQILGQFSGLLVPPASVVAAANSAAARAATFISSFKNGNDSFKGVNHGDTSVKAGDLLISPTQSQYSMHVISLRPVCIALSTVRGRENPIQRLEY